MSSKKKPDGATTDRVSAASASPPARPSSYDKLVALVLQGGGALGSYQAGVYEALSGSEYEPDWVAGISIGAINAAIIAGNPPGRRVEQLRKFWGGVTSPTAGWSFSIAEPIRAMFTRASALSAIYFGVPGFFAPRPPFAFASTAGTISYYDTTALRETLERLVDFDRINRRAVRFSVGAVNLHNGNFRYFDNAEMKIGPEHLLASAAFPPAFPPVEIDGDLYWDGGLVSNTPLEYVLSYQPRRSLLSFQVDVFPATGPLPKTLDEVTEREKDIRYSSRTRKGTDTLRAMHDIRRNLMTLLEKLPPELLNQPETQFLDKIACVTTMDIAQLIYRPTVPQGFFKDYEFSRPTMSERWAMGRADAEATLLASPWLEPMPSEVGVRTFDVAGTAPKGEHVSFSPPR